MARQPLVLKIRPRKVNDLSFFERPRRQSVNQIAASMPDEDARGWQLALANWYMLFGFPDRQFELVLATDLTPLKWSDAEVLIHYGTIHRRLGFTAHPKYLEVVEEMGLIRIWEQRGPPDYCEKVDGAWVCE